MRLLTLTIVLGTLATVSPRAEALRCGGDLVREGDLSYSVRAACGEPDWTQAYHGFHGGGEEVWHYNFGPNDLIRILHFRDGRLRRIQTAGRGFLEPDQPGPCRPADIVTGMTALELLKRCGDPAQRDRRRVHYRLDRPTLQPPNHHRFREVFAEDWYYDFGDNYLARRVRLVDGVVVEIDTAD